MSHVFSHTWERCRIWGGAEILGLVEFQLVLAKIRGSWEFFSQSAQSALEHQLW